MTKAAREFVSKKIRKLRAEGVPERQAIAEALSMARSRGYDIPPAKRRKVAKRARSGPERIDRKTRSRLVRLRFLNR
jgi:hypothetical protein